MKTLSSAEDREVMIGRVRALGAERPAKWGKMNAGEMICHLNDSLGLPLGEQTVEKLPTKARPKNGYTLVPGPA